MDISQLFTFNPKADVGVKALPFINYLDTASVYKNSIERVQKLKEGYPSRAQRTIRKNDILISSVRPNLEHNCIVHSLQENMVASTGFIHLRIKEGASADPDFVYYFLTSPQNVERYTRIAETSQSAYPSFNKDVIERISMPSIDLTEQKKIGLLLSSVDRLIELERLRIEYLERLVSGIYDYWFVQFDFPDKLGKPYKSSGGKLQYCRELKREIPFGWVARRFGELIRINEGQVNPLKLGEQILEHYSIPAYDDSHFPVFEKASSILSNKFKVSSGVFLVSKLNPEFKRLWDPVCITTDAVCSTEFIVCRSIDPENKPYCFCTADSEAFQLFLRNLASSSTGSRKRLAPEDILDFKLPMPTAGDTLERFNEFVGKVLGMIKESRKSIHEHTVLRDFLVPLLMNGQAKLR